MSVNFDSIMNDFINESNELLDKAESDVLYLEKNGFDQDVVNRIFRAIHTIKGNSGLFELGQVSKLAHAFETVLNHLRNGQLEIKMDLVDLSLSGVDRLREMIRNVSRSEEYDVDELVTRLESIKPEGAEEEKPKATESPKAPTPPKKKSPVIPPANGNGKKSRIRIPARHLEVAREKNMYLNLLQFDLLAQDSLNLNRFMEILQPELDAGNVLGHGVRGDHVIELEEDVELSLPYYMILLTDNKLDDKWSISGISPYAIKSLFEPETPREAPETQDDDVEMLNPEEPVVTPEPVMEATNESNGKGSESGKMKSQISEETGDTHLRVPIKLIDTLINLAGEAVIARNELTQRLSEKRDAGLESVGKRMSYLITRLQEGIMRTRLQELNTVFQKIPRIVRDASSGTGKRVELIVDGGEVELDKALIDAIGESIMHIIRNAVDHGIEPPEERLRIGKKEQGLLRVKAQLRGGNVILSVKDDGRGLNLEKIKAKAIASGRIGKDEAAVMSDDDIMELVFMPGLSTAAEVSRTSGRGVGMDVVRSNLKKVGGSVDIISEFGKGTNITATLPQTLSIVTCLMISSCSQLYALPQQNVVELILLDRRNLRDVEGHEVYELRGHLLPLLNLGRVMDLPGNNEYSPEYIVVVRSERHHFGLLIDRVVNLEEIVVKRLGAHFSGLSFFSGAAILGDGESVLILDVPGLAKFTNLQSNAQEVDDEGQVAKTGELDQDHLLFSIYGQQFAVSVKTIPRIEKINEEDIDIFMGIEVIRYRDEVVPVVRLDEIYDLELEAKNQNLFSVIIFHIDGLRTGIIASDINNVVSDLGVVDVKTFARDSIIGHSIIGGTVTLILDAVDLIDRLKKGRFKDIIRHVKKGGTMRMDNPQSEQPAKNLYSGSKIELDGIQEARQNVENESTPAGKEA